MPMVNGKWQDEDAGVAARVDAITKSDSPLMKSAETKGVQYAARRGLGNSSIAAEAAQKAVIETATPIAAQEASQAHQRNLTGMGIEDAQTRQRVDNEAQMGRLSFSTAAQERMTAADLASREKLATADLASRTELGVAELNSREKLAGAQLASSDRQTLLNALNQSSQTYADTLQAIMANPKIPAPTREAYMRNAQLVMQRNQGVAEAIFGAELDWR